VTDFFFLMFFSCIFFRGLDSCSVFLSNRNSKKKINKTKNRLKHKGQNKARTSKNKN